MIRRLAQSRGRGLILFAFVLLLYSLLALAQQQTPQPPFTVSVSTQLVIQTVSVTDKDGKALTGLTADDFTVTEDNVPQTIKLFEFQKIDDSVAPRTVVPAQQQFAAALQPTTTRISPVPDGDTRYQDRRLLAIYFDMSALDPIDRFRALTAAQAFIEKEMKGPDLVALFTYSDGSVRVRRDFTDNKDALIESIQRLLYPKDTDVAEDTATDFGQNNGEFNLFNTDRQLAALQTAVNMLGALREKKSLIYFASGLSLNGVDNQAQLRATLNAARRANVSFYPVDARGLVATAPMGNASQKSPGGLGMYTGATAMASLRVLQRSQDALYTLAADTGGKALLDSNDLSLGIVRAQQAQFSYYILGYYSTNTNRDGRLRKVKVTLKDRSADLSYRESYYADKEFSKYSTADKERQLEEAMMLGNPITDITIVMEMNYFRLNNAEYFVPLAVKIPGSELVLAQKEGAERTVIDFIWEIKDESGGTTSNNRDKVEIKLKGETAGRLASSPVQYDGGFTLFPGKYTIKFLARNAETGRIGTFQSTFVVPNLNKETTRLLTSSVVLSSQRVAMADALFNTGKTREAREQATNPLIEDGQKLIPSVTRVFSRSRDLYIYLQAYERDAATMHPLAAVVTLLKGEEVVFESPAYTVTEGMDPKSKAVPFKLSLPLGTVEPGEYVFQINVLDPTVQKAAFWQAPIKIVP